MGQVTIILWLVVFAVLATAKEFVLEDLIAEESGSDIRRVIHNVGDDVDQTRGKKVVRQSRIEDTIRTVQEPITGPGFKEDSNQGEAVKDKGGGKKDDDEEDKKTLSQQVADGKYGLIQTELFNTEPKRPGIISYEVNPEVPKDNVNNFGGLKPEEIWLAENHLLVLSGGNFKEKSIDQPLWPPIDNYIAPPRPVKIPLNPKVPPPFPVQLKPGGPLEFIKNENGTGGQPPFFPLPPNTSFPYPPPNYSPGNFTVGNGPHQQPPFPFPFPSPNGSFPFLPPGFLPPIPPGAAFLPPPGNLTDQFDEDDPSLYYPPPYDFYYPKDNSSLVPPGPLVPGIVLPPPPDFFAPFKNTTASKPRRPTTRPFKKPTTRKPTKHKNVQVITSTEEPYNGVKIRPNIGKINIVTKPPPHTVYTTQTPYVTTEVYSRRPTIKTTTDHLLNEVTPPPTIVHALPPNAVVKGWVPIPAPHPYYITGPRKPHRKGTTSTLAPDYNSVSPPENQGYIYNPSDYGLSINNWLYQNKTKGYKQEPQYFKVITESPNNDFYYDDLYSEKGQYYSSTEGPFPYEDQTKLKSLFYPTSAPPTSTVSPAQLYQSHFDNRGKSLKTYYFYEEPHLSQGKLTDTENVQLPQQRYKNPDPHTITQELYVNTAVRPSLQSKFKPSPLDYFFPQDEYVNIRPQKASTESPIQYYYPEKVNSYGGYPPYPAPVGNTPRPETATKPPVYEYSFAIPGYGALEPPKVSIGNHEEFAYQTTPRPFEDQIFTTSAPTTTPTTVYKSRHKDNGQFYTTKKPSTQYHTTKKPQHQEQTQTENPYYAFFTHHDAGLIDDITKKYFTTFGQKLNKDSIKGEAVTTPLPPTEEASTPSFYSQTSPRTQYYENERPRTKYTQNGGPAAAPVYYTTVAPPIRNYPQRDQYSEPVYSQYYDQRPYSSLVSTQKPISLGSDILVNFKEPLPPINPDAEFIDPSTPGLTKPDQSFISYRLPGNGGGHFFFLTPQIAQQSQQFSDYMFSADQSSTYYKRNARRPQTQRRRPANSRTT